jgi:hypothetical protein
LRSAERQATPASERGCVLLICGGARRQFARSHVTTPRSGAGWGPAGVVSVAAVRLVSCARAALDVISKTLDALVLELLDQSLAMAREQLDEPTFTAEWTAGRTMTLEEGADRAASFA